MILIFHADMLFHHPRVHEIEFFKYMKFMNHGVEVFFMMSGWLNAKSISTLQEKNYFWEGYLKFMIRKIFRLAPLYYCFVIIYLCFKSSSNQREYWILSSFLFF